MEYHSERQILGPVNFKNIKKKRGSLLGTRHDSPPITDETGFHNPFYRH